MGDYKCPQSHTVFNPLKKIGYESAFHNQKTSLKKECKENKCLASEFDKIWYKPSTLKVIKAEEIHFYNNFATLKQAREISDHVPITLNFTIN